MENSLRLSGSSHQHLFSWLYQDKQEVQLSVSQKPKGSPGGFDGLNAAQTPGDTHTQWSYKLHQPQNVFEPEKQQGVEIIVSGLIY